MAHLDLPAIGWKPFFQQQLPNDVDERSVARVAAHYGSQIVLLNQENEFALPVQLTESVGALAVGDWVVLGQDGRVTQRLVRLTTLSRKTAGNKSHDQLIAANIDTIFVVCSCNQEFNLSRIERYLAITLQAGSTPVVVLTKADLCEAANHLRRQVEELHSGLLVETLDARDRAQVHVLNDWCSPGQTVALLGSSGVGKSTLANSLGAGNLLTGRIREQDGKGRHTTTSRSLHCLANGGVLIDTPGMRELQLPACAEGVSELFQDVIRIADACRFNDCNHDGDEGCAVAAALRKGELDQRRVDSFKKLLAEQAHNARSAAERRERDRGFGKMYKSVINEKRRRRGLS